MRLRTVIAMLLLLVTAAPASATVTLYTPPQLLNTGLLDLWCVITNVSSKPVVVSITVLSESGSELDNTGEFSLDPLRTGGAASSGTATASMCRFTVNGAARAVRASSCVFDVSIGCISTVPAE